MMLRSVRRSLCRAAWCAGAGATTPVRRLFLALTLLAWIGATTRAAVFAEPAGVGSVRVAASLPDGASATMPAGWLSVALAIATTVLAVGAFGVPRTIRGRHHRAARPQVPAREAPAVPPESKPAVEELVCRCRPDTTLTFVNDAYCRFFGREPRDLLGRSFLDLIPAGARKRVRARVGRVAGTTDTHEHEVLHADGTVGWQRWTNVAITDAQGRVQELVGFGRDVTLDRAAAESVLRAAGRQHALLRAVSGVMFVLRADGTCLECSSRESLALPTTPVPIPGHTVHETVPPGAAASLMAGVEKVLQSGEPVTLEYELTVAGSPRWFEAAMVATDEQDVVCLVRDTTAQRRQREEHRDLAGRLIASQESERQRIARELHDDLSQEIALLAMEIDQFAHAVAAGDRDERLGRIAERIASISTDVHDLSYELHPSKLQTLGLVSAVRSLCSDTMHQYQIDVDFVTEGIVDVDEPEIALCLYRVSQEALHNVVRHSQAKRASVQLRRGDGEMHLQIADQGVGFEVLDGERTGLGLVSMRERVGLVGGRLAIHAFPGGGTRIGVRVPVSATVSSGGSRRDSERA